MDPHEAKCLLGKSSNLRPLGPFQTRFRPQVIILRLDVFAPHFVEVTAYSL